MLAVRATETGVRYLEHYLDEQPVYVLGKRRWTPSQIEVAVLACAPSPDVWTNTGNLYKNLQEAEVDLSKEHQPLRSILNLERDGLLAVFREFKDTTSLQVAIGCWTFEVTYAQLRRQTNCNSWRLERDILDKGKAVLVGVEPPALEVKLR